MMTDKIYTSIIIDDEHLAIEGIEIRLRPFMNLKVLDTFRTVRSALEFLKESSVDVIFLDIQMPKYNGFDFLKMYTPTTMPIVIFITAYKEFALEAYHVRAFDYILKPIDDDRFEQTIIKLLEQFELESYKKNTLNSHHKIKLKSFGVNYFLDELDIISITSEGDYIKVQLDTESLLVKMTLSDITNQLNGEQFKRIHRSTLINIDNIKSIHVGTHGDGTIVLTNSTEHKYSRSHRENILTILNKTKKSISTTK